MTAQLHIPQIEHGIPLPPETRGGWKGGRRRAVRFPWAKMQPGDSFFVPDGDEDPVRLRNVVVVSASHAGKRLDRKFAVRRVEGGIRAWRTK